jgi:hypothetical protein
MRSGLLTSLAVVPVLLFALPASAETPAVSPTPKPAATPSAIADASAASTPSTAAAPKADAPASTAAAAPKSDAAPTVPAAPAPAGLPGTEERSDASMIEVAPGWKTNFYGFVEFDAIRDSTQSFYDSVGNNPIMRSDGSSPSYLPLGTYPLGYQYGASHPRTIFSARNTRFGFKMAAPEVAGVKLGGLIETDFMGNQPANPYSKQGEVSNPNTPTETAFFSNAAMRVRHAYIKLDNSIVDVLFGQYYHLFGFQPNFFPASAAYLGLPNEIFGRTPQLRLTKVLKTDPVNLEVAAAALRPAQADSGVPDLQGGIRFLVNPWKGAHGSGAGRPTLDALSIGVSGVLRQFKVAEYTNNRGDPTVATTVAKATRCTSISVDALVPVIPVKNIEDRSNGFTLTGSFVSGYGIGDLFSGSLVGGAPFPRPEGPQGKYTGFYGANIDPGIIMFDANGIMRVIKWTAYMAGFQYYLPIARGNVVLTGNYTHSESPNLAQTILQGGDPARTFDKANYYDLTLFVDWMRAFRTGLSWQRIEQKFTAGMVPDPDNPGSTKLQENKYFKEKNDRFEFSAYMFF